MNVALSRAMKFLKQGDAGVLFHAMTEDGMQKFLLRTRKGENGPLHEQLEKACR